MQKRKTLFVPVGGLANRMRAIDSIVSLCKHYNRTLEIIWFKDLALNAGYYSLFEPIELPNVTIREATRLDYFLYDRPRKHNLFVSWFFQMFAFRKRIYEQTCYKRSLRNEGYPELASNSPIYMASFVRLAPSELHFSMFNPIRKILNQIGLICDRLGPMCIGIHIRRGDNMQSTIESPLSLFIDRMDKAISTNPETTFYLATDSENVKRTIIQHYGKRITTLSRSADRLSDSGMQDAVMEMYILASTKKIFGCYHSSYSVLAAELGNIPYEEIRKQPIQE